MLGAVPIDFGDLTRIELAEAADNAAIAVSLQASNAASHVGAWPLAGGQLVITGAGFYVNRGIAIGLTAPVTEDDFEFVEAQCRSAGVPAELEVCPWADASLLSLSGRRGYRPTWFRTVLAQSLPSKSASRVRADLDVRRVEDDQDFEEWYRVTVVGFDLRTPQQRDVARRWGDAIRKLGDGRLLLARLDGVPVGVGGLAIHGDVALLGGMTTVPEARRQGVQNGLISWRLARSHELGCTIAASTADPGSTSEANLQRQGFAIAGTKLGVER
jgi:GNAT superfamily N-acetyltransferase